MRTNIRPDAPRTHEGAVTTNPLSPLQQLRRTVLTALLFEDTAYEDGETIASRVMSLVPQCNASEVAALAIEARELHHLRHVPLLLLRELCRNKAGRLVGDTIARVVSRPDELGELVSLYWRDARNPGGKRRMLPKQMRVGLSRAFAKFDEYQLAKYNRGDAPVKLRDVLFMAHAKPKFGVEGFTKEARKAGSRTFPLNPHELLYKRLVDNELATPDTWEVRLSEMGQGENLDKEAGKKAVFTRLLMENKLGAMALLRNLRNMAEAGVDPLLVTTALQNANVRNILPFRFVAAANYTSDPAIKAALEGAMMRALSTFPRLRGSTVVLVDVSGSMSAKLSSKSDLTRKDAAATLAMMVRGVAAEGSVIACFDYNMYGVSSEHEGFELVKVIRAMGGGGTLLGQAITNIHQIAADRYIIITDEQSQDRIPNAKLPGREYIINCAPYQNGVGFTQGYTHIDGFSESTIAFIQALESLDE